MSATITKQLGAGVLALVAAGMSAEAQVAPAQNQACVRLESQLAAIDRGSGDPARAEQIRRYEDASRQQQAELDRTQAQAHRLGCESSGFFLFARAQPQQCG